MGNVEIQKLYSRFFTAHRDSMAALSKILEPLTIKQEDALSLIETIVKLWDDFDVDARDLILGALKRLTQKVDLSSIPAEELQTKVFFTDNRRRLLRDTEIRTLFSQLSFLPPVDYKAAWLRLPKFSTNPNVVDWLKQHDLNANPFGAGDFRNYSFYPEGFARPDKWTDFLSPIPHYAQCPTPEDARALAFHLRLECLPTKKVDAKGNEAVESGQQVFPVWVSFNQASAIESPLLTLARSAAQAWLDILCLSPDAMLDLASAEQDALLELLCWSFGSSQAVINLLKRTNLQNDSVPARLLVKKINDFRSEISSTRLPPDSIFISWLKIKPPELNYTYLILPLDEIPTAAKVWWLEQFCPLISTLFLNGVITKAFSSSQTSVRLLLSEIQLNWPDENLKTSLNSQFDAAMKKTEQEMGKVTDFRSLFGSDPTIGYFETEENTTDRLISSSRNSLARMLTLGNRLLQHHCEKRGASEKYLYVEDLETILKTA